MSRTIKTMPPAIIARDHHGIEPWHDHRFHACDLPDPADWQEIGWVSRRRCQWTYTASFHYSHRFCGCRLCTDYDQRRWERRRSRHQAKAEARQIVKYGYD